jgi:hypothetical protein
MGINLVTHPKGKTLIVDVWEQIAEEITSNTINTTPGPFTHLLFSSTKLNLHSWILASFKHLCSVPITSNTIDLTLTVSSYQHIIHTHIIDLYFPMHLLFLVCLPTKMKALWPFAMSVTTYHLMWHNIRSLESSAALLWEPHSVPGTSHFVLLAEY